jgi:hypothetical protein
MSTVRCVGLLSVCVIQVWVSIVKWRYKYFTAALLNALTAARVQSSRSLIEHVAWMLPHFDSDPLRKAVKRW